MERRKQCSCGHLNDFARQACEQCGRSLRRAPTVWSSDDPPPDPADSARNGRPGPAIEEALGPERDSGIASTPACRCASPLEDGANPGFCARCDGQILNDDSPQSASRAKDGPAAEIATPRLWIGEADFPLSEGLIVGRDKTVVSARMAHAVVRYPGVSRRHLWAMTTGDELLLLDLGSKNGSWLDGKRLPPLVAERIQLDALPLTLRLGANLEVRIHIPTEADS